MDHLKNAAIIILGMGEEGAAEILRNMSHKEVELIIETMKNMGDVSEQEVISALNAFFNEANNTTGINVTSGEYIRKTFMNAVGQEKAGTIFDEDYLSEDMEGMELLKWQPLHTIIDVLGEEHPQMITVALMSLDSEKSAQILSWLPKEKSNDIINRMTVLSQVSSFAMKTLSDYLLEQFSGTEKFKLITSDGVDRAANIIAHMDGAGESEVMSFLTSRNETVVQQIQEKLFPFERLGKFDSRSLQTLLTEISNDDLVLALKAADPALQNIFFKSMSSKTVSLIKDDLESLGPKKSEELIDAQKRIVDVAKRLLEEEKIILPGVKGKK
ncbi:MAG: FliG C-terminal domain-containing protein [Legionella sp.]|nr:FliG C-terminal domain-containing protein [Legionella sp.]